jgi:hypothetical protein
MKNFNFKKNVLFVTLFSIFTFSAVKPLVFNRYKFVPQQTCNYNSSYLNPYLNIIEQQQQTINMLSLMNLTQGGLNGGLNSSYNFIPKNLPESKPEYVKTEAIKESKLKKASLFVGNKTLGVGKFIGKNLSQGMTDVFAKGLKRAGSLSLFLPVVGILYWRLTGKNPLIPAKEFFRFSKFSLKNILTRPTPLPEEIANKQWYRILGKVWDNSFGILNPWETRESIAIEAEMFKDRFSPDEIFYGGAAILVYLIFFR